MADEKRLIDADALMNTLSGLLCDLFGYQDYNFGVERAIYVVEYAPTVDAVEVVHGRWIDGVCSNCKEEAFSRSWDEPIYDYDWEENLRYSYTETHTEYQLTDYCPNCGARMDGGNEDG